MHFLTFPTFLQIQITSVYFLCFLQNYIFCMFLTQLKFVYFVFSYISAFTESNVDVFSRFFQNEIRLYIFRVSYRMRLIQPPDAVMCFIYYIQINRLCGGGTSAVEAELQLIFTKLCHSPEPHPGCSTNASSSSPSKMAVIGVA